MEIEVESRRDNKLLQREEIRCTIQYDGATPTRKKVREALKGALGIGGHVVIHEIKPFFGIKRATVYAKVYSSESAARTIEEPHRLKRDMKGGKSSEEPSKKAEKPKEEPAEKAEETGGGD
jgi:ribosomal protein S24E